MRCRICTKVMKSKGVQHYVNDRTLCRWCIVMLELDPHYLTPTSEISLLRNYSSDRRYSPNKEL